MNGKLTISAWDLNPSDSIITRDLIFFLNECFKTASIVTLKESEKDYTVENIEELATDILNIREAHK